MASAQKLLEQKEYREITVLDLVADSGVNRNTFYYHFKDMPAMLVELSKKAVDRCFALCKGSSAEKMAFLIELILANKTSIMHVYSSADRAVFDGGLDEVCEHLAAKLGASSPDIQMSSENEKAGWCLLVKSCCYGLFCGWLSKGLDEDCRERLCSVCADFIK